MEKGRSWAGKERKREVRSQEIEEKAVVMHSLNTRSLFSREQ